MYNFPLRVSLKQDKHPEFDKLLIDKKNKDTTSKININSSCKQRNLEIVF